MHIKFKSVCLVGIGMLAGFAASMHADSHAQNATDPLPLEELRQFADVFALIKAEYVAPVESRKLIGEAIAGMVSSLDPHSAYLDKEALQEMSEDTQGRFHGVGIEAQAADGYIKVVSPMEDSPAYRAGIQPGDLIVRVDATPTQGMTLEQMGRRMRGDAGTSVTLTVARKAAITPLSFSMTREEIHVQSVKAKFVAPGIVWLRVAQFQDGTVADLCARIKDLYAQNPNIKGLVLDLRNDPGGLLSGAVGVSAIFLPRDAVIVSTKGKLADSNATFYAKPEFYALPESGDPLAGLPDALKHVPMVVLVNTGSASASEIVAGALQDHRRATIIGTQTFGKGSVQQILPLSHDTAVKLTVARYYTPAGRSIQATGIAPDLIVDDSHDDGGFNQALLREADLRNHLANDRQAGGDRVIDVGQARHSVSSRPASGIVEFGSANDFQLAQALNHLRGLPMENSRPAVALKTPDGI